ncbi:MAG: hypothetical protein UZ17_ACD001001193 [Acidobacteria bacterium OLB17]|nr:MAG: hypothetical protein UZ17_ACD001001193 [Acidobacteria bacterium OLB17]MCZ2391863.1 hypothetical protein [Acidobacteriota bacterium]
MDYAPTQSYSTDDDIFRLVERFENCSIPRDEWKHREHVLVALVYVSKFDLPAATEKMRRGILRLLEHGFGVDLGVEMPYHETLTIFWMNAVHDLWKERRQLPLAEIAREAAELLDKDLPLRSYSRELLFSEEARKTFVGPDLI